jgi:putative methyltransferase (TIGR04325 family)
MSLRRFAKLLMPPFMLDLLNRVSSRSRLEAVPEGWNHSDARLAPEGWDVEAVLDAREQSWLDVKARCQGTGPLTDMHEAWVHNVIMTFAYALALSSRGSDTVSMLDWGGVYGHYYLIARALFPGLNIDYHCKEVPKVAARGSQLLSSQRFYSDDSCLERSYRLVLASGSLHYSEDWQGTFRRLALASEGYVLATRLPIVTRASSFAYVQRRTSSQGHRLNYLGWCLNQDEFLAHARSAGLSILREFVVGESHRIHGAPEQCLFKGFLFQSDREERMSESH